jgi:adenosine/AMP kinase
VGNYLWLLSLGGNMELKLIKIEKPEDLNMILGQTHFIKTVEDIHEALVNSVPGIKFGIGFCEASQQCLVRFGGNDDELIELAKKNAFALAAGHSFIVLINEAFPINVLRAIKQVPEVCNIFCATSNPVEVIVAESDQGRGILGVIDGSSSKGIESESDIAERKQFLRDIGYKL